MSDRVEFNPFLVTELFIDGIIDAPLEIRAEFGEKRVDAILTVDGKVKLGSDSYPDLQQAMDATVRQQASTSSPWQFWTWFSEERRAWTPLEHLRARLASKVIQQEIRTSDSHPLRIDSVAVPGAIGQIGLTFCPGKRCEGLYGGVWDRDLHKDISAIKAWGGESLITLMEDHEFELLSVPEFTTTMHTGIIDWLHLPIPDMQTPDKDFERKWKTLGPRLHQQLVNGHSIVIHCRGGIGRTGLLAARMLVEAGINPVAAVAEIRAARSHSIETYQQEHYVLTEAWKLNSKR